MPSFPFFGISTLVHLLVIAWNKTAKRLYKKARCANRRDRRGGRLFAALSFAIIAVIIFISVCGASFLVTSSLIDSHSSLILVPQAAEAASVQAGLTATAVTYALNGVEHAGWTLVAALILFVALSFPYLPELLAKARIRIPATVRVPRFFATALFFLGSFAIGFLLFAAPSFAGAFTR